MLSKSETHVWLDLVFVFIVTRVKKRTNSKAQKRQDDFQLIITLSTCLDTMEAVLSPNRACTDGVLTVLS